VTDDVKNLLGRAFGDEPPLRLDRDEVIERGRKRLRRKRFFEAGGVVAAVVVAALGAATLTNLSGSEPDRLPPAASSTYHAPPSPSLPMTTDTGLPVPPSVATTSLPSVQLDVTRLTSALYSTGILSAKEIQPTPGQTGRPRFRLADDQYVFEGDAYQSGKQGYVHVLVGHSVSITADRGKCGAMTPPATDCSVRNRAGGDIVVTHFQETSGERHTTASAVMSDGLRIYALASNETAAQRGTPAASNGAEVVLTDDELCVLVAKVGALA
jgi:hypothetical protein